MPDLKSWVYHQLIRLLGREWLEYFISNSMNLGLHRLSKYLWTYDCKALIVDVIQETPTTKTFVLLPNQHFAAPVPGQHIELSIDPSQLNEGRDTQSVEAHTAPIKRCYTISQSGNFPAPRSNSDKKARSNSDTYKHTIGITVKSQPAGLVSNWLHQQAKPGIVLDLSGPRGRFIYQDQKKLLFICAGSGITPCFAILNQFSDKEDAGVKAPEIRMYYRSLSAAHTIFKPQLESHSLIKQLVMSFSDPRPEQTNEAPGETQGYHQNNRLTAELNPLFSDLKDTAIYLCGPTGFRDHVIDVLQSIDFDMNHLHLENFTPAPLEPGGADGAFQGKVMVHLASSNESFTLTAKDQGKTLLESAEANGIKMVHGCRTGMCGTCKTRLISGDVVGARIGNAIYPCVCYPASAEIVIQ